VVAPLEIRLTLPLTVSTVLVVSQSPYAFALLNSLPRPLSVMSPDELDILFDPDTAVPPHPMSNPMWFPVPVTDETRAPSISMDPVVEEIAADFSISIPAL
jgi:hypothetical protein